MPLNTTEPTAAAEAKRPRRSSWLAALATLVLLAGMLGSAPTAEAAKYPYKPPVEVFVANTTTTTAEITFRTVTGAPIYRVKAVAKGHKTRTAYTGADGNWVITGLDPNTTYTFTVACAMKKGSGHVLLSKESSGKKGKKTGRTKNFTTSMRYPTTVVNGAPVDNALWLADTANPTNSQFYNGADVGVKVPDGFDYTKHKLRFIYSKNQRMTSSKSYEVYPTSAPVSISSSSSADLRTTTSSDTGSVDIQSAQQSVQPETSAPVTTTPTTTVPSESVGSPSQSATTAAVDPASPTPDESVSSTPETPTPATPGATPSATATATAAAAAAAAAATPERAKAVLLASTTRGYPSIRVKLDSPNTNYYVRVQVVWRGHYYQGPNAGKPTGHKAGTVASDTSQALLVKTRSKFGFISGKVVQENGSALPLSVCRNYVVQAYGKSTFSGGTKLDVHQQVSLATANTSGTISCTGDFTLEVRPNSGYTVRLVYVGTPGGDGLTWRPAWYRVGSQGVAARSVGATKVTVSVGRTTTLANPIRVGLGGNVTGTAKCPKGSGSGTSGHCTVDVAAIYGSSNYNNVVQTVRSNSSGKYTLRGLPAGKYTIRVTRTEDSIFAKIDDAVKAKVKYVEKRSVTITAGKTTTLNIG